ncbi:MAG: hypothetical protein HGA65_11975 [Oscillochloris sp.]|nr:hypothetical protein [Oscillochloris sp.]
MPDYPPRRDDEPPREGPIFDLARSVGSLLHMVSDVANQIAASSQTYAPPPRPPQFYRPTFRPSANPTFMTGFQPSGADQRLAAAGREPLVDLFDEGAEIVIVVEWPDGDVEQIEVSVQDDVLALAFGAGAPALDLLLPAAVSPASLRRQARNGIVEIRLRRA